MGEGARKKPVSNNTLLQAAGYTVSTKTNALVRRGAAEGRWVERRTTEERHVSVERRYTRRTRGGRWKKSLQRSEIFNLLKETCDAQTVKGRMLTTVVVKLVSNYFTLLVWANQKNLFCGGMLCFSKRLFEMLGFLDTTYFSIIFWTKLLVGLVW